MLYHTLINHKNFHSCYIRHYDSLNNFTSKLLYETILYDELNLEFYKNHHSINLIGDYWLYATFDIISAHINFIRII